MNEPELNEAISLKLHKGSELKSVPLSDGSSQTMTCLNNSCRPILDYCGNWNALWQEIMKTGADVRYVSTYSGFDVEFDINGKAFKAIDHALQRALAECLLKLTEVKG